MNAILEAVVPLFVLIVLGFVAGRARQIEPTGVKVLVSFVFNIALPPLLFRLVVNADLGAIVEPGFVAVHLLGQLAVAIIGAVLAHRLLHLDPASLVIQGFGSGFPNSVLLGIPLLIALFGDDGALLITVIFVLNVAFYSSVTLLLMLATRGKEAVSVEELWRSTARAIFRNPIILAAIAGLALAAAGVRLPEVVDRTLGFIGQAGPAAALFALGASLGVRSPLAALRGPWRAAALMSICKLFLHPLIVWFLAVLLFGLAAFPAQVAIIVAALPIGANVYIFAQHHDVAVEQTSTAILLSTAFSMLTLPLCLWLVLS